MGRRKVEMKRIEDKNSRRDTFSRRRKGLMKKARELSVLCDVSLDLVIFSRSGKLYEFSSGDSLARVVERYRDQFEASPEASMDIDGVDFSSKYPTFLSHLELLEIVESELKGPNIERLSTNDLVHLERQLDTALSATRERETQLMMESLANLHQKERLLRKENEFLKKKAAAMTSGDGNDAEDGRSDAA